MCHTLKPPRYRLRDADEVRVGSKIAIVKCEGAKRGVDLKETASGRRAADATAR
jgi:hypothetical protein